MYGGYTSSGSKLHSTWEDCHAHVYGFCLDFNVCRRKFLEVIPMDAMGQLPVAYSNNEPSGGQHSAQWFTLPPVSARSSISCSTSDLVP